MCEHHEHVEGAPEQSAGAPLTTREEEPPGALARVGISMVRWYQRSISPLTPPTCRFQPTCSQYTLIAIRRYGLIRGSWMGARRIMRCHPLHPGGYDPVP